MNEFKKYLDERPRLDPPALAAQELIDRLVALRKDRGVTQEELAKRMSVTQATVSGFETEMSDPRLSTVQRYAQALGADVCIHIELSLGPREG